MAYVTNVGEVPYGGNAGNLLLNRTRPNGTRPLTSGNNTILQYLHTNPEFSEFLSLVYTGNMYDTLDNIVENKTLFVPTNTALRQRVDLLNNLTRSKARSIVKHHITRDTPLQFSDIGDYLYDVLNDGNISLTVDGRRAPFKVGYNNIGGAFGLEWNVVANMDMNREIITKNGVIHPIDKCIFPYVEILG